MAEADRITIDVSCACGAMLFIQYQVHSPYRDDLCKLAVGWVAAHSECQKAGIAKEPR